MGEFESAELKEDGRVEIRSTREHIESLNVKELLAQIDSYEMEKKSTIIAIDNAIKAIKLKLEFVKLNVTEFSDIEIDVRGNETEVAKPK